MQNMELPVNTMAPVLRSGGLFADVARPIVTTSGGVNRLGLGVVHVPWGCDSVVGGPSEACAVDSGGDPIPDGVYIETSDGVELMTKDAAIVSFPEAVTHPAFKIVHGLECSALSFPNDTTPSSSIQNRLRGRMRLQLSKMLTAELVDGALSGGPNLADDSESLGSAADVADAAVLIESWLASVLHNAEGVVVLPVGLLPAAIKAKWVTPDFRTVSGHQVIADAGFTGDPTNPKSANPSTFSIFALGDIGWSASDASVMDVAAGSSHVGITDDMVRAIAEAYAQIAFDPCAAGEVTLAAS